MEQKILIVEDDPHILLGLEEVLKSEGFEVAVCNRGDQAGNWQAQAEEDEEVDQNSLKIDFDQIGEIEL